MTERVFISEDVFFSIPKILIYLNRSLTDSIRTVKLSENNDKAIITPNELGRGKVLFAKTCSACHTGGITKTNPNIGLALSTLKNAIPERDNVVNLVQYMKYPTAYDGTFTLNETHPNTTFAVFFPSMRTLTEKDLYSIAGYILVQAQVLGEKWGGGKVYY
uniref:Photosystem II extrinsic protein V n=2 Tax=Chromera velia TaxID=505693 RepID=D9IXJ6_9ALVE|nr:photosystem II cytochrome c550 [Chromera velia]ADJ66524.1 photosystem II cytochrome c550 [Chromera velia]